MQRTPRRLGRHITEERPEFFMMYLKDNELTLSCYWHVGNDVISVKAAGLTMHSGLVYVNYQFTDGFRIAKAAQDQKAKAAY
jgi:hypothetical protein